MVGLLNSLLTSMAETEQEMVSVERVQQYVEGCPSEAKVGAETIEMLSPSPRPDQQRGGAQGAQRQRQEPRSFLRQQIYAGRRARQEASGAGDAEGVTAPLLQAGYWYSPAAAAAGSAAHSGGGAAAVAADVPAVVFSNVWLQYRTSDAPALRGLSFEVAQGCKLGICGRTGARCNL